MATTVQISDDVRKRLEELKVHKREPLNDVIKRLIEIDISAGGFDSNELEEIRSSLIEIQKGEAQKFSNAEKVIKYLER
jgi:predicted CopG family antitoxin